MVRTAERLGLLTFLGSLAWWIPGAQELSLPAHGFSMLVGFFLADWFSGIVHWSCDHLGTRETPFWGEIVRGFRDHHDDPMEITRIPLSENLGYSAIAGTIVFWIFSASLGVNWITFWFLFFAFLSNLFHRWSHFPARQKPWWMKRLQKAGILLRPEEHSTHHREPFRVNYCILSGWANGITNRTPWGLFEKFLSRLGVKITD